MSQASTAANTFSAPLPWQVSQWLQLNRARSNDSLAHAYLFAGCEGLGKSLFAHSFAKSVLCQSPVKKQIAATESSADSVSELDVACGACSNCLKGGVGNHPDLLSIEPEEGSKNIKIDQIRRLSEFVIRSSHSGGAKFAIIEQAHLLNGNAANALLKTLEEPNRNTHVILVSDYPGRLVATIRSRCQKLAFPTPSSETTSGWLQQYVGGGNIDTLLQAADGRPLTALRLSEGDSLEARAQFLQSLCDMKLGQKSIQQVVALSAKIGESEVLQHLSVFLTKLIKYSLVGALESDTDPALDALRTLLGPPVDKATTQPLASALSHFYIDVETARKQLASSTNPNPQLIMDSILWRWSKLSLSC
ncbi:MAG: DNA polymerase III subunit delta' [Pseudohongiellaceae bacterium]